MTDNDHGNIVHLTPRQEVNDAASACADNAPGLEPDPGQIGMFLDVVFGYCEGWIPFRGFVDKGQGFDGRPHNIWIEADEGARHKALSFAAWAARGGAACYVIPGTVAETGRARAADIRQMQTVVVDLDAGDINAKRDHLVRHLGEPTLAERLQRRQNDHRPARSPDPSLRHHRNRQRGPAPQKQKLNPALAGALRRCAALK